MSNILWNEYTSDNWGLWCITFHRSRKNTLNCTLPILLLYMFSSLFRDLCPPRWLSVNLPDNAGHAGCADLISGSVRPLEKEMATHASILAWKPHEQRSLAGYSPWSHKASDKTEWLNTAHVIITFILKYLHDKKSWRILKMYLKKMTLNLRY